MNEPFRDSEHVVRERAAALAREIHALDSEIKAARTQSGPRSASGLTAVRASVFSMWTVLSIVVGVAIGGIVADKTAPRGHVIRTRISCSPF